MGSLWALCAAILLVVPASGAVLTTFAGGGSANASTALSSLFLGSTQLSFDSTGNLYIANERNIRMITAVTQANPNGISVLTVGGTIDQSRNVWVNRARASHTPLGRPTGVFAVDSPSGVYFVDAWTRSLNFLNRVEDSLNAMADLSPYGTPYALTGEASATTDFSLSLLFISFPDSSTVLRYSGTDITPFYRVGLGYCQQEPRDQPRGPANATVVERVCWSAPQGMVYDSVNSTLYVADTGHRNVKAIVIQGAPVYYLALGESEHGQPGGNTPTSGVTTAAQSSFSAPVAVAVSVDQLYVVDAILSGGSLWRVQAGNPDAIVYELNAAHVPLARALTYHPLTDKLYMLFAASTVTQSAYPVDPPVMRIKACPVLGTCAGEAPYLAGIDTPGDTGEPLTPSPQPIATRRADALLLRPTTLSLTRSDGTAPVLLVVDQYHDSVRCIGSLVQADTPGLPEEDELVHTAFTTPFLLEFHVSQPAAPALSVGRLGMGVARLPFKTLNGHELYWRESELFSTGRILYGVSEQSYSTSEGLFITPARDDNQVPFGVAAQVAGCVGPFNCTRLSTVMTELPPLQVDLVAPINDILPTQINDTSAVEYEVYIASAGGNCIFRYDSSRDVVELFLGVVDPVGGYATGFLSPPQPAQPLYARDRMRLRNPGGMTYDSDQGLFIFADTGNQMVRFYYSTAEVETDGILAGGLQTCHNWETADIVGNPAIQYYPQDVCLLAPRGVTWHPTGLYIADAGAHVVWLMRDGYIRMLMGTHAEPGYAGDGVPSSAGVFWIASKLDTPWDVVLGAYRQGSALTLYVADKGNNVIRSFEAVFDLPKCITRCEYGGTDAGLTGGALAGVVIGVIAAMVSVLCCLLYRRRRSQARHKGKTNDSDHTVDMSLAKVKDEPLIPAVNVGAVLARGEGASLGSGSPAVAPGGMRFGTTSSSSGGDQLKDIDVRDVHLQTKVGEGVSGVVYKAIWRGTECAAKVFRNQDDSKENLDEFVSEVQMAADIGSHPRVIQYLGAHKQPPHLMLLMVYMPFGSVEQLLCQTKMFPVDASVAEAKRVKNVGVVVQMVMDASAGLLQLHSQHIVHRDVAARNFLVDALHRVTIADFGMAVKLTPGELVFVAPPKCSMAVRWASPEMLTAQRFSTASDVFMFGVFMWECIARTRPYGAMDQMKEVAPGVHSEKNPLRPTIPAYCPPRLAQLMRACWAHDPSQRPSIADVNKALSQFLGDLPGSATLEGKAVGSVAAPEEAGAGASNYDTSYDVYDVYAHYGRV